MLGVLVLLKTQASKWWLDYLCIFLHAVSEGSSVGFNTKSFSNNTSAKGVAQNNYNIHKCIWQNLVAHLVSIVIVSLRSVC